MDTAVYGIFVVVVQPVCNHRIAQTTRQFKIEVVHQIRARTATPTRNKDISERSASGRTMAQLIERIQKQINAFVTVFVAPGSGNYKCIVLEFYSCEGARNLKQLCAGSTARCRIFGASGDEIEFKAIRCHNIGTTIEKLGTFSGGDIAHSREAVGVVCGGFFKRMLRLHVKLRSHLVAVIVRQLVVERFSIAADAAAYACGVSGEYGGYVRHIGFQSKKTHCRGPLVEMSNHMAGFNTGSFYKRLYDSCRGTSEITAFVVVAVGVQRVDTIEFPHAGVVLVTCFFHPFKLDKHGNGTSGDVPASDTHVDAVGQHCFACHFLQ